jgi:hypothetical protein
MSDKKHNKLGLIIAIVVSAIIFLFAGWLLLNQQYAKDQVSIWAYARPENVKAISDRIDFTDKGSFYFLASQPKIADADDFNTECPRQEPGSPILGCYAEGRIYIFDIENAQLDGIEEVTAAHETLHAIWERMSADDQKRIGSLLRAEYAKIVDTELKDRMDYYARTQPGEFENELHSIIGTEMESISVELEQYYAKYFDDRSIVVDFHNKYDTVFKALSTQSESLYNELVALGESIEVRSAQYSADVTQLSADIQSFNSRADSGSFSSLAQFNEERSALIARSNQLEADRLSIQNDITLYDQKYDQYQALALQIQNLNDSIDSIDDLQPAPSL